MPRKERIKQSNPFLFGLQVPTLWRLERKRGNGTSFESYQFDTEHSVKVYFALTSILHKMTEGELKLLHYIISHYPVDKTKQYLELRQSSVGIPDATFLRAKKGLIIHNVIAERADRKFTYWINPSMMCNGNRVKLFPANCKPENSDPLERLKKQDNNEVELEDEFEELD